MANRLRTLLSLLGITIGIFLIISVFTLVDSLEGSVRGSFAGLGEDAIFIEQMPWGPEPGDKEYAWWKYMQRPKVLYADALKLKERMKSAKHVTFFGSTRRSISNGGISVDGAAVVAVSEGYPDFIPVDIVKGRGFSASELESARRVCVLGYDLAESLFGSDDPIGKSLKVGGYKTTVIGTLDKKGSGPIGNGSDEWCIIPVGFGRMVMDLEQSNTQIALKPKENVNFDALENEVLQHMRSIRRLRPAEEKNFAVNKSSMLTQGLDQVFGFLNIAGLIIGGFSILVGGFSIANIMFVSVRERTNIIGIQKALGAKRFFILAQFLFESVGLCILGGAVGLVIIFLGTLVVNATTDFELSLSLSNIMIGLSFSAVIGLISGFVPALQAAKMEPVEAIRTGY